MCTYCAPAFQSFYFIHIFLVLGSWICGRGPSLIDHGDCFFEFELCTYMCDSILGVSLACVTRSHTGKVSRTIVEQEIEEGQLQASVMVRGTRH